MAFVRPVSKKMDHKKSQKLGRLKKGAKGRVLSVSANGFGARFYELGFIRGATVEIIHTGPFGGNPLAIKVCGAIIAMRQKEADHIEVEVLN